MTARHVKYPGVEACRFLCALAVSISHYRLVAPVADRILISRSLFANDFASAFFSFAYEFGPLSVQIFWVISGFIFFENYGRKIFDKSVGMGTFAVWRFSRLYPLHLLTLIVVLILQRIYLLNHANEFAYSDTGVSNFLSQLTLSSNWFTGAESF